LIVKQDNFFHKVYAIVCQIPEGKVSTYGAIGKYLGSAKSVRMVAWALNKCPSDVPAHRLVNQKGLLTGKIHFRALKLCNSYWKMNGLLLKTNKLLIWKNTCGNQVVFSAYS